jgi:hypothetical protein
MTSTAMESLTVAGIGTSVTLRVCGSRRAELDEALRGAWSRCLQGDVESQGETLTLILHAPDEPISEDPEAVAGVDLECLLPQATQAVTRALIRAQTGRLLMLHAGAVANPGTGRSLVFVAPGGTGKTTLTRLLGQQYGYLSDETVAIDADGVVLAYPKPLSVRSARGPKREHSPDELGLLLGPAEARLARLVLLERDDGQAEPQVTELGLLDAIEGLAGQSSALYELPSGLRLLARLIEATGPVLRVRYTEAEQLTGLAAELIGGDR